MVKLFSQDSKFDHPWSRVVAAFWRKYPNPNAAHVKKVDTFRRSFDPETGELTTYRLITCERDLPGWITACGVSTRMYALEKCVMNSKTKTMTLQSRNLTCADLVLVDELCEYRPDLSSSDNAERTQYIQKATITASVPGVGGWLEGYSHSNLVSQAKKGFGHIDSLCHQIASGRDLLAEQIDELAQIARDVAEQADVYASETRERVDEFIDDVRGATSGTLETMDRYSQTFQHQVHAAWDTYAPSNFASYGKLAHSCQLSGHNQTSSFNAFDVTPLSRASSYQDLAAPDHGPSGLSPPSDIRRRRDSLSTSRARDADSSSSSSIPELLTSWLSDTWSSVPSTRRARAESVVSREEQKSGSGGTLDTLKEWVTNFVSSGGEEPAVAEPQGSHLDSETRGTSADTREPREAGCDSAVASADIHEEEEDASDSDDGDNSSDSDSDSDEGGSGDEEGFGHDRPHHSHSLSPPRDMRERASAPLSQTLDDASDDEFLSMLE